MIRTTKARYEELALGVKASEEKRRKGKELFEKKILIKSKYKKEKVVKKEKSAIEREERLRIAGDIPKDRLILHYCRYEVECKFSKNGEIDSFQKMIDCFDTLQEVKGIAHSVPVPSGNSSKVFLHGYGLYPKLIRTLLHNQLKVVKITARNIEIKGFPVADFDQTATCMRLSKIGIDEARVEAEENKSHRSEIKKTYLVYGKVKDFWLKLYLAEEKHPLPDFHSVKHAKFTFGNGLEAFYEEPLAEGRFERKVAQLCTYLAKRYGKYLRYIKDVVSPNGKDRPSGTIILPKKNPDKYRQNRDKVLSMLKSAGSITDKKLLGLFAYLKQRGKNSPRRMADKLVAELKLKPIENKTAWTL